MNWNLRDFAQAVLKFNLKCVTPAEYCQSTDFSRTH